MLNVYEVAFDGAISQGKSIVVAPDEARALAIVKFALSETPVSSSRIDSSVYVVRQIDTTKEGCIFTDYGDF